MSRLKELKLGLHHRFPWFVDTGYQFKKKGHFNLNYVQHCLEFPMNLTITSYRIQINNTERCIIEILYPDLTRELHRDPLLAHVQNHIIS